MSVSWDFYSKRRRTTLQKFMVDNSLSKYDDFVKYLQKLGVNPPTLKIFDSLYKPHIYDVPIVQTVNLIDTSNLEMANSDQIDPKVVDTDDVSVSDDKLMNNLLENNLRRIGSNRKKSKIIDQPEFRIDEDIGGNDNAKNTRDER